MDKLEELILELEEMIVFSEVHGFMTSGWDEEEEE